MGLLEFKYLFIIMLLESDGRVGDTHTLRAATREHCNRMMEVSRQHDLLEVDREQGELLFSFCIKVEREGETI